MANLGVVPWFRFLAFLLFPIFFLLFSLRVRVTLVKETMKKLLQGPGPGPDSVKKRWFFLPLTSRPVKGRGQIPPSVLVLLLFQLLKPLPAWSFKDHVIAIGEHVEISSNGLHRFSVTARDVLSYKWLEQRSLFLVEGKKKGYSELIIWNRHQKKRTHRFYVLSKNHFLKLKRLQKTIESMNIRTTFHGDLLVAEGVVKRKKDYLILHKILKGNQKKLHLNVSLDQKLRNDLMGKAYKILFTRGLSGISCSHDLIDIVCFYQREKETRVHGRH